MNRVLLAVIIMVMLAGCSYVPPVPDTVRVRVPVPCLGADDVPIRPGTASDADLLAMDDRSFVLALVRDRDLLSAYAGLLEALVSGCR